MSAFDLKQLEAIIAARGRSGDEQSWTAKLFAAGMEKAAQKMGEEAVESVIAAVKSDREALIAESADLLYHWLVVLAVAGQCERELGNRADLGDARWCVHVDFLPWSVEVLLRQWSTAAMSN